MSKQSDTPEGLRSDPLPSPQAVAAAIPAAGRNTAEGDRIAWREKIGLGFGKIAVDGSHGTLSLLVNPVYNMTLGVNPALISTVVFVQRLWDALIDPLWGHFSDNFRSRWGRRRPLLAISILPLAGLFLALWVFPGNSEPSYLFWHLLVVSLAFYSVHSLYAMPLGGLTLEATDDYHERTKLAAVMLAFGFAFNIGSQWIFPLTHLTFFSDGITGLRWIMGACALCFVISGLAPIFLCRERRYHQVGALQPRQPFAASLRAVRGNPTFLRLLGARFISMFGYYIVGSLGLYMNTYYIFGGNVRDAAIMYGFLGTSFQIAAIGTSIFVFPRLARRYGKKRTLQIAASTLIVGCLCKLGIYQPAHPWFQLIVLMTNGASFAGLSLMTTAMLGDVADLDEWHTGLRREALFSSVTSWADKMGNSLGTLLTGFVLVGIGFDAKLGGQSLRTLELMKYSYCAAPLLGALLAIFLMEGYNLDEARAYSIKSDLDLRRAAPQPQPTTND